MELKKIVDILWRRKWILVITTIVAGVVAGVGTHYITPMYTASAVLRVAVTASGTLNYQDYMYTDRLMNTYVQIAKSEPIAEALTTRLLLAKRPKIDAQVVPNTELIQITIEDTNPARAAKEANTLAEILIAQDNQLYTGSGTTLTDVLQAQLAQVQSDVDGTRQQLDKLLSATPPAPENIDATRQLLTEQQANYATLQNQYQQALLRQQLQASMITVWQPAQIPQAPSWPIKALNYALGVLVGLVGGLGIALVAENLDTTLYTTAEIEAATGQTALARIPYGTKRQLSLAEPGYSPVREAYRKLATLLHQRYGNSTARVMLVVSAEPNQGKSTLVLHLAVSLAELGKSVIVIDCDSRIPRLHGLFHLPNKFGLSSILQNELSAEDAIQAASQEGISVLTSGSAAAHPSRLLGSPEMTNLMATLRRRYDYILLDSPALLAVADTAVLRPYADTLLLLVRRAHAAREPLRAASTFVDELKDKSVHLVINQAESSDRYGYHEYRDRDRPESLADQFEDLLIPDKNPEPQRTARPV